MYGSRSCWLASAFRRESVGETTLTIRVPAYLRPWMIGCPSRTGQRDDFREVSVGHLDRFAARPPPRPPFRAPLAAADPDQPGRHRQQPALVRRAPADHPRHPPLAGADPESVYTPAASAAFASPARTVKNSGPCPMKSPSAVNALTKATA